jgi:eukaryotic-like serine/threonine-protein kinase
MFTGVKWKFQTNGRVISSPAFENGLVYVGSVDKNLYAVDQQAGALKCKFATEGPVKSSPALAGGIVYFASYGAKVFLGTSIPGLLHAVDAKAGAEMFSLDTKFPVFASLAIADGMFYFGTLDGKYAAVDLKTQKLLGSFRTTRPSRSSPQSRIPMGP